MLRPPPLLLLSCALALASSAHAQERKAIPEPVACNNDDETCRENCTIEFGSSFRTRAKLGVCLDKCRTRHHRCTEQWTELHRNDFEPVPPSVEPSAPAPAPEERTWVAEEPSGEVEESPRPSSGQERTRFAGDEAKPSEEPAPKRAEVEPPGTAEEAEAPSVEPRPREERSSPRTETARGEASRKRPAERTREPASEPAAEPASEPARRDGDLPPEPKYDISDWDPNGD